MHLYLSHDLWFHHPQKVILRINPMTQLSQTLSEFRKVSCITLLLRLHVMFPAGEKVDGIVNNITRSNVERWRLLCVTCLEFVRYKEVRYRAPFKVNVCSRNRASSNNAATCVRQLALFMQCS